jgi:hypothetical protein
VDEIGDITTPKTLDEAGCAVARQNRLDIVKLQTTMDHVREGQEELKDEMKSGFEEVKQLIKNKSH